MLLESFDEFKKNSINEGLKIKEDTNYIARKNCTITPPEESKGKKDIEVKTDDRIFIETINKFGVAGINILRGSKYITKDSSVSLANLQSLVNDKDIIKNVNEDLNEGANSPDDIFDWVEKLKKMDIKNAEVTHDYGVYFIILNQNKVTAKQLEWIADIIYNDCSFGVWPDVSKYLAIRTNIKYKGK